MNTPSEIHCPHCLHPVSAATALEARQQVLFEHCARCGTLWLDFGPVRPRIYTAVEAQSARWDQQHVPQRRAG